LSFGQQLLRNFTALGTALGVLGWAQFSRRHGRLALATALIFALNVAFYAGYAVSDKATMFLPAYVIWAIWIALGLAAVFRWAENSSALRFDERRLLSRLGPAGLVIIVALTCVGNWRWADMSDAVEPDSFARQALSSVAPDAMVVGQWSTAVILEYYQLVEGLRPDVIIFNLARFEAAEYYELWRERVPSDIAVNVILHLEAELVREATGVRHVYLLDGDPYLMDGYRTRPVGPLIELVGVEPVTGT
jgi:hypothetical protein